VHGGQGEIGAQWLVLWQGELGGERLGGERADVADLAAGQVDRAGAAVKSQVTHGDPICGRRTERRAALPGQAVARRWPEQWRPFRGGTGPPGRPVRSTRTG
jgi:hypothetical protein